MSHKIKERLKTLLICILAITGLIQVGILWSYQNQGTPTSFLPGFLGLFNNAPQINDRMAREKLFVPNRLILSDGSGSHWAVENSDGHFRELWNETSDELCQLFDGKIELSATSEKWSDIIEKEGFMIDFGYILEPDLLSWFLGADDTPKQFPDIRKIMIKSDIVDNNYNTLYICDSNGKVYASDPMNWSKPGVLDDLIKIVTESEGKHREYRTFGGAKMGEGVDSPDVIYVTSAPKYWPYSRYDLDTFAEMRNENELASIILGREKDRYTKLKDGSDTIQFNYGNNIYRYYPDGYLTYRYLGLTGSAGKAGIESALLNAYKFIARIHNMLNTDTEIKLAYIDKKTDGSYVFGFDYALDGLTAKVSIGSKDANVSKLENAIRIQANSERVLSCDWLLKQFRKGSKGNYNDRFTDLLYPNGVNFKDLRIQDIAPGYFIGSTDSKTLSPVLIVRQNEKGDICLNMVPETGE